MIIKSQSKDMNAAARKQRDSIQKVLHQRAYFVPSGLDELLITTDEATAKLLVIARDQAGRELDLIQDLPTLEMCREYAEIIVKEAGLSEDAIRVDSILYLVMTVVQNSKGLYEVFGQGMQTDHKMGIRSLGSYQTLEEARGLSDYFAMSYDCPVIELTNAGGIEMRDLFEELYE